MGRVCVRMCEPVCIYSWTKDGMKYEPSGAKKIYKKKNKSVFLKYNGKSKPSCFGVQRRTRRGFLYV